MSIALTYSPLLLLVLLAVAGALAFWAYRGTVPALSRGPRTLLTGVRFVALGIVIFLLFEPVARNLLRTEQPPVLAVLVDNSQSIPVAAAAGAGGGAGGAGAAEGATPDVAAGDAGASAGQSDSARTAVQQNVRSLIQNLIQNQESGDVELFRFDSDAARVAGQSADSLDFAGARTNITQGLTRVQSALENRNLGGVLLLSDGQYNTGRNPLYAADRYPVPVYTVALGDTTRRRDVQIYQVTTNEITYSGEVLPVEVTVRAEHAGGANARVTLLRGGSVLDRANVTLPDESGERTLTLEYTPEEAGLQHLTVRVSTLPGEITTRNNAQRVAVRVLESKKQIALLAAAPGPDVAGINRLLARDQRLTVRRYVQRGPGTYYGNVSADGGGGGSGGGASGGSVALPDDLEEMDALVLVGWPGDAAQPASMRDVAEAADSGVPVLFLLTRQTDLPALREYLGDVLSAAPAQPASGFSEAQPVPTATGESHPILRDVDAGQFRRLPPLVYSPSRWEASPDARTLATIRVQGVELNDPLLAIRSRAGDRSAAWLGAGTWRWATLPQDLEDAASVWPDLFSNLMQWVTTPEDDRRVRVSPTQDFFGGGEEVRFTGQVYNESLEPISDASVTVTVTNEEGRTFPLDMRPAGSGRYTVAAGTLPEGSYRFNAEARRDGQQLGTDDGVFSVGDLTLEYRELRADVDMLRQIAARSGGQFFFPDSLGGFSGVLAASQSFQPKVLEERQEVPLWHLYVLLFVVVGLLATEWVSRKRLGLV